MAIIFKTHNPNALATVNFKTLEDTITSVASGLAITIDDQLLFGSSSKAFKTAFKVMDKSKDYIKLRM